MSCPGCILPFIGLERSGPEVIEWFSANRLPDKTSLYVR